MDNKNVSSALPEKKLSEQSDAIGKFDVLEQSERDIQEAIYIEKQSRQKNIEIMDKQLRVYRYQLWSSTIIGVSLAAFTALLAIYTKNLAFSTDILRDSNLNQVRPYLGVSNIFLDIDDSGKLNGTITIKNAGTTTATDVYSFYASTLSPKFEEIFSTYGHYLASDCDNTDKNNVYPDTISPQDSIKVNGFTNLVPKDFSGKDKISHQQVDRFPMDLIDKWKSDDAILFVQGVICYRDMFKSPKFTRFCRAFSYRDYAVGKGASYNSCNPSDSD